MLNFLFCFGNKVLFLDKKHIVTQYRVTLHKANIFYSDSAC